MKATHKLTYIELGIEFDISANGDLYYWKKPVQEGWNGQHSGWAGGVYSNDRWSIAKLRTFDGNK